MPIIEMRIKHTEESKKNMARNSSAADRKKAMKQLAEKLGLELVWGGYSMANDEVVIHLSGDPAKIPLLTAALNGTGAFASVRSDILVEGDEMSGYRVAAQALTNDFIAPNQDEIDRRLLDE